MSISRAFSDGFRKAGSNFKWLFLIFVIELLLVLFPGIALKNAIGDSLNHREAATKLLQSFDQSWFDIFHHNAGGLEKTFRPEVSGSGAVLEGLDAFISGRLSQTSALLVGLGVLYLLLWTFFAGGLIARFQQNPSAQSFFADSARYFGRFFCITFLAGIAYLLIFRILFPWLSSIVHSLTRETVDERVHFAYTVVKNLLIWLLVWSVNLIADYAKIHIVTEELRNPLKGVGHALGFVYGHIFKTYGLYFLIGVVWIAGMVLYVWLAPGAAHAGWGMILFTFFFGQLYILWRIYLRGVFLAAQTALTEQ